MKKYLYIAFIATFVAGCSPTLEKKVTKDGTYSGLFTHGNFSDSIIVEIQKDSTDWKVFFTSLEQNAVQIPARSVEVNRDSINFVLQSDRYTYSFKNVWKDGCDELSGALQVDTLLVPFTLQRNLRGGANELTVREIEFLSADLKIHGSLWQPKTPNNEGLVFLTSSGGADRSGSRAEAIYFAKKGYTTFHYDKRGTGATEGNWQAATMGELVLDDQNAIVHFSEQTGIPLTKIGIKGSSQGATKVPAILHALPELKYGISVSCPASTLLESDLNYWKNRNRKNLGPNLEPAAELQGKVFEHISGRLSRRTLEKAVQAKKDEPWFPQVWVPNLDEVQTDEKLLFSPMPYFGKTGHPLLIIQGKADEIIPSDSHVLISAALDRAENRSYQVVLLEDTNHSMQYGGATDFPYWSKLHKDYLPSLEAWIDQL